MLNILKKYKIEILFFIIFVFSRLPDLGSDMFNTDVWKWKARTYDFGTGVFTLDFEKTIQKYHPGVTLMWIGTASVKTYNLANDLFLGYGDNLNAVFGLHFLQKLFVVIVLGLVLSSILYALRNLFWLKYALIAMFLISVEPLFMALSRVVHLEGLMSVFLLASFVWLFYFIEYSKLKKHLVLSGIFGGLAILTKTSAIFIVPFSLYMLFLSKLFESKNLIESVKWCLKDFVVWFLVLLVSFFVLWPAMYTHASLALATLYRGIFTIGVERSHLQLYFGEWVENPGWLFYLVVLISKSSLYLLAGAFGIFAYWKQSDDQRREKFRFYCVSFAVLYLVELTIPAKKLDRYILPSVLTLILSVSLFYEWLYSKLEEGLKKNTLHIILLVFIFAVPGVVTAIQLHPNYLSYYSPLVGGMKKGVHIIEPKWMFGQKEVTHYFENVLESGELKPFEEGQTVDELINKDMLKTKLTIGFQEKYYTQIWPFVQQIGARAIIKDLTAHAKMTNYFVYPIFNDDSSLEDRFDLEYVDEIKIRGIPLYNVYKRVHD